MIAISPPAAPRRRFRFSLRALLAAVTVAAVGSFWQQTNDLSLDPYQRPTDINGNGNRRFTVLNMRCLEAGPLSPWSRIWVIST